MPHHGSPLRTASAIIQLAACGGDLETPSHDCTLSQQTLAADSGTAAAPLVECSGELPVMIGFDPDTGKARAPDWSCYAEAAPGACPVAGPEMPATIRVTYAPGNNVTLAGVVVDQFFGPSTLGKPAFSGVTDSATRQDLHVRELTARGMDAAQRSHQCERRRSHARIQTARQGPHARK